MDTYSPKLRDIKREWHVIDAAGKSDLAAPGLVTQNQAFLSGTRQEGL